MRSLVWVLCLSACSPAPHNDARTVDTGGDAPSYTPDWAGVVAFSEDHCVSCHTADGAAGHLVLPDALADDLTRETGRLVVPLDPEASLLWRVTGGSLADGDVGDMPISGRLPLSQTDHIRQWILTGAPFDAVPLDDDQDGVTVQDGDCDDLDASVFPGAPELCDGVDNDCDDEVDNDAIDAPTWYPDQDADGYGIESGAVVACEQPTGTSPYLGDCDDQSARYNPGADESNCNDPNDYNCDGNTGRSDNDGDGFFACQECDDGDRDVHPLAVETCDQVDNDCDGRVDAQAVDATRYYPDADGDGYGDDRTNGLLSCTPVQGGVANNLDCDDTDAQVSPANSVDVPDGLDNDCDGDIDEDGASLSHDTHIQPVWDNHCLGACHDAPRPSGDLDLSQGYDALVGVASDDVPSMPRIDPGDPDNSYLWHKLNGTHQSVGGTGNQMPSASGGPPGSGGLPQQTLDLIESWIVSGANR